MGTTCIAEDDPVSDDCLSCCSDSYRMGDNKGGKTGGVMFPVFLFYSLINFFT